jgi:hypothetical protein
MAIATAVVREGRVRTLVAAITVPAQCRRSTLGNDPEDSSMLSGHPGVVRLQKPIAVLAHDIGHLEGWPRHRLCSRRDLYAVSGLAIAIASNGFATPCRCRCDKCR